MKFNYVLLCMCVPVLVLLSIASKVFPMTAGILELVTYMWIAVCGTAFTVNSMVESEKKEEEQYERDCR